MSKLKTIADLGDIKGKKVIVRADLNVPAKEGKITDATRITAFAPTAKFLSDKGAKVIILTHFDRPGGKVVPEMSAKFMVPELSKDIGKPVAFAQDCIGDIATAAVAKMNDGDVVLLENVRFHPGEDANDETFAKELASLGEIYVDDAFSVAHRDAASNVGITKFLPSYAGFLMAEEVNAINGALENPARPSVAIVAGSKISTKIPVLENVAQKVDYMIIGGAMVHPFLTANGVNVGASLTENDMVDTAKKIMATAKAKILLPVDVVVAKDFAANAPNRVAALDDIADDDRILDVGPKTVELFKNAVDESKTALINGPVGVFELKPFDTGTNELFAEIAKQTAAGKLMSVAGGGDTVSAIKQAGLEGKFTYTSKAGGAFMETVEGKKFASLPPLYA